MLNRHSQLLVITTRQAMYYKRYTRRFRVTIVAAEKLKCYIFCVSVALVIRVTKPIGRIIFLSVAGPTLPNFPHYHIIGTILRKKIHENEMCVLIFSTIFV
jgi:hypothetical protein